MAISFVSLWSGSRRRSRVGPSRGWIPSGTGPQEPRGGPRRTSDVSGVRAVRLRQGDCTGLEPALKSHHSTGHSPEKAPVPSMPTFGLVSTGAVVLRRWRGRTAASRRPEGRSPLGRVGPVFCSAAWHRRPPRWTTCRTPASPGVGRPDGAAVTGRPSRAVLGQVVGRDQRLAYSTAVASPGVTRMAHAGYPWVPADANVHRMELD